MKKRLLFALAFACFTSAGFAQQGNDAEKAAYRKVITERADKIAVKLDITEASKKDLVRDIIADQYIALNDIHSARDEKIKSLKADQSLDKSARALKISQVEAEAGPKLARLHNEYMAKLSKQLSRAQIEKVKDGMTYSVLPITYKGYMEMLPNLNESQKEQILAYLTEAREYAMNAGSSDKKHAWFGKYKGKINNYLSAQGVETKKAREEWEQKLKEREQTK
ncbi:MAG: DUF3826 domain-containing protein [Arcticibacter sp.]